MLGFKVRCLGFGEEDWLGLRVLGVGFWWYGLRAYGLGFKYWLFELEPRGCTYACSQLALCS